MRFELFNPARVVFGEGSLQKLGTQAILVCDRALTEADVTTELEAAP